MGWQDRQTDNRKHVRHPYCPFRNFCVFLNGEDPAVVLAGREYLRGRVDELEFAMDFTNSQVIKLKARVKELEDANSHLEKELVDALKDPFAKYEKKEPSENPKKRGAPFGHEGHFRKKPDKIDKKVDVYLDCCPHCGGEDISPCNHTTEHIQEDLEDGRLTVTCFVHYFYWCRNCKRVVHGWGKNEIPHAFIGPEARAKTSFLRHEIKTSYDDAQRALQYLCGLTISAGSIVAFDDKFSNKAKPLYEALKESLSRTPYIHADETGWKRDWLWTFTNPHIAFFHIDESRGSKVVMDHLGSFYNGTLITDFWNAYRSKIPAFAKQKCIRHILGDIKDLLDKKDFGEDAKAQGFLEAVKELFKDAVFLYNQHSALTPVEYRSGRKDIIRRFRKLYQHEPLSHHESDNIRKRLVTFKNELFIFLKYPETINPTNNLAERTIRNAVLFRKITFGNMTKNGKNNVSIAMTIIRTALLRALDPIKILQNIMTNGVTPKILEQFNLPSSAAQAP